jgi:hypothetical protein
MKNMMNSILKLLFGASIHAKSSEIKGRLSGGKRDGNGKDWIKVNGSST